MNIAIIPARGGSKRIPKKNIKLFDGKPIIYYSINAARKSGVFDQIIVTTDDSEIASIANSFGAATPFIRPEEIADDFTPTVPVIAHAILACEQIGLKFNYVCCIYPCNPFVHVDDLRKAAKMIRFSGESYCFPITEFPSPIQRALSRNPIDGSVTPFEKNNELVRSQDLEKAYYDSGQFYFASRNTWMNNNKIHSNGLSIVIPNWRVVDIDTTDDWRRAEILYQNPIFRS